MALKKGTKVVTNTGDYIGDIDEVLTNPGSHTATHLVLSQGALFKTHKLIPIDWVRRITDEQVELSIDTQVMDRVRDYDESVSSVAPETPII